jgi:hypothetical protein
MSLPAYCRPQVNPQKQAAVWFPALPERYLSFANIVTARNLNAL